MKKTVLLLMGLLFVPGLVSAYYVTIDAPATLAVGKPLIVTGNTSFGIGTPVDIVLYHQVTTSTEIQRVIVYVQPDHSFVATFDTTGLAPGTYKAEAPPSANSDSVTIRQVVLYDRTDDIILTSPVTQTYNGTIALAGEIRGKVNAGIQVEVIDSAGFVIFGPQYITTDNAAGFMADIPIREPGVYEISFTDASGYIGSRFITINSVNAPGAPRVLTGTTQGIVLSAHAPSSRDMPAYFIVKTEVGPVMLYTSKSTDLVLEYIDDQGILHTENERGDSNVERVEFFGQGKTVYVKIYPYKYATTSDVSLYGENVKAVFVSPVVPPPFAAVAVQVPTPAAPTGPGIAVFSLVLVSLLLALKKKIPDIH